jgi:hypothetical protein
MFGRILHWLLTPPDNRSKSRLQSEARFVVSISNRGVSCRHPSGQKQSIDWDDLHAVVIATNGTGPWGTDVWWWLKGPDGKPWCSIPQGATGEDELLERLQRLPGFDNQKMIQAMSCTENQAFVCWGRPSDA